MTTVIRANEPKLKQIKTLTIQLDQVTLFLGITSELYRTELTSFLNNDENIRALAMSSEQDRKTFITCRAYLKHILSHALGQQIDQLNLEMGVNGKPYLHGTDVHFNVSHSNGVFVIAITGLGLIGVDLEHKNRVVHYEKLMDVIFSEKEKDIFESMPSSEKQASFLNCWTRKEAFFKAKGSGLTSPLKDLHVSFSVDSEPKIRAVKWSQSEKEQWTILNLPFNAKFMGAVAVNATNLSSDLEYTVLSSGEMQELLTAL